MASTGDIAQRYFDALSAHDRFYTLDRQTGKKGGPRIPHPAFDVDVEQTRASIRKLAELGPWVAWAGHADAVADDAGAQLQRAAAAPL